MIYNKFDERFSYEYNQKLISAMSYFLSEYPFELFVTHTFKRNIQNFHTAFKMEKAYFRQLKKIYPQIEFAAMIFGSKFYYKRLHLHTLMLSNPNKSMTFSDMTANDLMKMKGLYKFGDAHLSKDNPYESHDKNKHKMIQKIHSDNVYDYIPRRNIDFNSDNWDLDVYRPKLLGHLKNINNNN